MSDDLQKRIDRLRKHLLEAYGSRPGAPMLCVIVEGGLVPLPAVATDDTGHEWIRDVAAGESIEDFAQRAAREAHANGAKLCTIGGMGTGTPLQREALRLAHVEYMRTEYSDVPPIEERGIPWSRPSRLGFTG